MAATLRVLAVLFLVAVPAAATAQQRAANPPTVQIPPLDDAAIEAWSEKLDRYATVQTRTIVAWSNLLRYVNVLGFVEMLPWDQRERPALLELERFAAAVKLAPELAVTAPLMPEVDSRAMPFAAAIEGMPAAFNEAVHYYRSGDHEEDGFANGEALHPRIRAAFSDTFQPFLYQIHHARWALNRQELAMLERQGKNGWRWHLRQIHKAAFDASLELPIYGHPDSQINLAAFDNAIRAYAGQVKAFHNYNQSPQGQQAQARYGYRIPTGIAVPREGYLRRLRMPGSSAMAAPA